MRTFVTTDTHGESERLKECLGKADFNYQEDTLIHLGDCVDRGPDSFGVVELLLSIKNLVAIRGNHDDWFNMYLKSGQHPAPGFAQITIQSYIDNVANQIPKSHRDFFTNQINYFVDDKNRLFLHAGYMPFLRIKEQNDSSLFWDRELIEAVQDLKEGERYNDVNNFSEVFIGHTPTLSFGEKKDYPVKLGQLWNLDTGGVFGGKITVLDITNENYIIYQT